MNDIEMLVLENISPNRVGTLKTEQALGALKKLTEEKLNCLTPGQKKFMLSLPAGRFSNQDLVDSTGKSKQNVSNVLRELKKNNFIRQAEDGEEHIYVISSEFAILYEEETG